MKRAAGAALLAAALSACMLLSSCGLLDSLGLGFGSGGSGGASDVTVNYTAEDDGKISVTNISAGTILDFFSQVAIGSEYGESVNVVCKWTKPVKYRLDGDVTDEDRDLISRLCERLNEIDGFPGISEVFAPDSANMTVSFVDREEIVRSFPDADETCSGMALYEWDSETGRILSARCAIDKEMTSDRACTLCEEFLQSLGPARDSYMIPSSVFYQGYTLTPFPTEMDFAVMALLYSPEMPVGAPRLEAMAAAAKLVKWGNE